jgi:Replication protein C N-terminal domain.
MTLGLMASQSVAKAMPKEAIAHKWHVFQHIREARELIGATDRSLAILNALLSFHPETALHGDEELIVWPSNEQLMSRANGMPATTLRRHLAVLVECWDHHPARQSERQALCRKGRGGEIEQAYGFDLSPLVARAEEFREMAEAVQAEKKAFRAAKERLTLIRRDIVKMIDAAIAEKVPGPWGRMAAHYEGIMAKVPRSAPRQLVEAICEELQGFGRTCARHWKHSRKHRIWTPMSPILVVTYRIQTRL